MIFCSIYVKILHSLPIKKKKGLYLIPFLYHSHKKTRKEQEQEPSYN